MTIFRIPVPLRDELLSTLIRQGLQFERGDTVCLTFHFSENTTNNQTTNDEQMTKSELISSIKTDTGVPRSSINDVISSLVEYINLTEKITLPGLGTFKHVVRPAHTARNPRTGETVDVPEKTVLTFKASK
jgi:nucleoid DNA-binding protein